MDSQIATIVIAASGISLAGTIGAYIRSLKTASDYGQWKGQIELKVDTLWEFQLRRGVVEGKMSDVLRQNSPIIVLPVLAEKLSALDGELRDFYTNGGLNMDEATEAAEIEHRFGDRLTREVCVPLGIFGGACIVGAMVYGRSLVAAKPRQKSVLSSGRHKAAS